MFRKLFKLMVILSVSSLILYGLYFIVFTLFFKYDEYNHSLFRRGVNYYVYNDRIYDDNDRIFDIYKNQVKDKVVITEINDSKYIKLVEDLAPMKLRKQMRYYIQTEHFSNLSEVLYFCDKIEKEINLNKMLFVKFSYTETGYGSYVVHIGPYGSESEAKKDIAQYFKKHFNIVKLENFYHYQYYKNILAAIK